MNSEIQQADATPEPQSYSVPWKPIDNWIGIFLLVLVNAGLLLAASQGIGTRIAQSAILILVQLVYLLPLVIVLLYRRIDPRSLGFGGFKWSTLGLGCGLLFISYMLILVHNAILTLLGVGTQGEEILQLFEALDSPFWFIIVGVIFAPIVEELFFRGFLFQGFRQKYGWIAGMLLSSTIFSIAHLDPAALFHTFILGCLLAYMYHRSNSVWPGIIIHVMINAMGLCAAYAATQFPNIIPV